MKIIQNFCQQKELKANIARSRTRLYRMAFSWTHDPELAADLTQETLVKALKNLSQLRDPVALHSWLFGILSNCMRDHFRKQKDMVNIDDIELHNNETPEQLGHKMDLIETVRRSIAQLNDGHRQIITLVDLEGFTYAEVATILGIPVGTVMSRLSRARQQLSGSLLDYKAEQLVSKQDLKLRRIK